MAAAVYGALALVIGGLTVLVWRRLISRSLFAQALAGLALAATVTGCVLAGSGAGHG